MPIYTFTCDSCGVSEEVVCAMSQIDKLKKVHFACGGAMRRDYRADRAQAGVNKYAKPIVSDSLAIHPAQVEEHRRLFPDIEIKADGRPVFTEYRSHEAYLEKCGVVKLPGKLRRRAPKK